MISINPYLNFPGNTLEAFEFYRSVFGGAFTTLQHFRDTPEASRLPEEDLDKIMHVALPIGQGMVLMGTDALKSLGQTVATGNNIHLSVSTENESEGRRVFDALAAGGQVVIPMEPMFWGALFGMVTDRFGVSWMVNCEGIQADD